MNEWKGIAASTGYALGKAYVLPEISYDPSKRQLNADEVEPEIRRFNEMVSLAAGDIRKLQESAAAENRDVQAAIFATHLSLLRDPEYIGEVTQRMQEEAINAEAALSEVTAELMDVFAAMDNDYLKERCSDLRDVSARIGAYLSGNGMAVPMEFPEPVIMIGMDLAPSLTAKLQPSQVAGFAVDIGGKTSHSAIIARSLGIPAVVGVVGISSCVQTGDFLIVDGHQGIILVNPPDEVQDTYRVLQLAETVRLAQYDRFRELSTVTADGHRVQLAINIANPQDALAVSKVGAEGIGLYRTEFLFMDRDRMPSEDEQYAAYKAAVLASGAEHPVIIRTLDVGGDKEIAYLQQAKESNPFLGYRAIRLCLGEENKAMFLTQLRAILRASQHGNVKLMYPMITTLQELRAANRLLAEAKAELRAQGESYNDQMEVGIMIEVPAAALIADQLAKEVDFFSIGTNDLVQYTMAADRMNEQVAYLTQPLHPAVLRLIDLVIRAAHGQGKWVGMCGEMAGHPDAIPVLLGLGLDEFSMSPAAVLPARELIAGLKREAMAKLAQEVLQLESAEDIENYVRAALHAR
ncbi:phosphoenolpyruvate--protein phosphotransferase [Paenibacillus pectinilyticus]|uniref:Phosphoenolpyruvate-protein phosphotransferase n=1 Tax=Paenibacillus pectinilyticus TaxID=512399 RepID=A0A1C1A726_9BACL|nr:phosphoenolpyruvate--protein phosphotransferase [Paenibacillus pectinilyticus]OCT16308.1 phosphoenolpyruvate--protein phosphotransferase [Paenibacillus pectinilyticus]